LDTVSVVQVHLSGRFLQVSDQVFAVSRLLEASENHLGSWDVLLGGKKVLEQGVVVPDDTRFLVGLGVGVTISHTRLASKESREVGSLLVRTTL
jgi:hypothetical protein